MSFKTLLQRGTSFLSSQAQPTEPQSVFPIVAAGVDGEDCLHDCESCPSYGRAFEKAGLDSDTPLWGGIKSYANHVVIATGETDWIRNVEEIAGSVMKALAAEKSLLQNGKLMISASNLPPPEEYYLVQEQNKSGPTTVIVLPSFTVVCNVMPNDVPELIQRFINPGPTTSDPLDHEAHVAGDTQLNSSLGEIHSHVFSASLKSLAVPPPVLDSHPYPHDFLIMICSHKKRDARCGISAPILRKEFEKHLRVHGLWRDINDNRKGGASVVFINHVGGHKFAANVLIYRKVSGMGIWLARVAPKHVEGIVKYTVLQGKVVHPEMVRGGFNRSIGATSW